MDQREVARFHAVSTPMLRALFGVALSRYIPDRFLPDKAIDLIDEAGRGEAAADVHA
jgi:ATP-dependent Clp protease ATP-binding subunit ClpA